MDGQLIVILIIHGRWALEIIIIDIQWDLRPVIWEFLLMTLACSFQYNTFFKNDDYKKQVEFHCRMVKITTKLQNFTQV